MRVPRNILITEADRGIGLSLVRQFCDMQEPDHLFAFVRNNKEGTEIKHLSDKRLHIVPVDIRCDRSIAAAFQEVDRILGDEGLNLLINNAEDLLEKQGEKLDHDRDVYNHTIENNAIAHVMLTEKFLPLLLRCANRNHNMSIKHGAIVNVISDIEDLDKEKKPKALLDARDIAFNMAKASLIEYSSSFARELEEQGILVVCMHPGTNPEEQHQCSAGGKVPEKCLDQHRQELMREKSIEYYPYEQAHRLLDSMCRLSRGQTGGFFAYNTPTPTF